MHYVNSKVIVKPDEMKEGDTVETTKGSARVILQMLGRDLCLVKIGRSRYMVIRMYVEEEDIHYYIGHYAPCSRKVGSSDFREKICSSSTDISKVTCPSCVRSLIAVVIGHREASRAGKVPW